MNNSISLIRTKFPFLSDPLQRWFRGDEGQLTMVWLVRFILLWVITAYFASDNRRPVDPLLLFSLKTLLLIFWSYVVFIGIVGVYRPQWQLLPKIKRQQVALEIVLFSTLLYLAQDPNFAIYYVYLLPLIVSAEYLSPRWSITMALLTLAGYFWVRIALTHTLMLSDSLPQVILLFVVFVQFFWGSRRRRSVLEDAKNETSEVMEVLNQYDEGIYVIDDQRRLRYVNETLKKKHGSYQPEHLCESYFNCSPDLCSWCPPSDRGINTSNFSTRQRGTFFDREGHPYQVETIAFPLLPEEDKGAGAIVFVRNIEERRELEKNLQQLNNLQAQWRETYDAMGKKLAGFSELDEMMQFLVDETRKRLGAETSALFLLEDGRLVRKAIAGIERSWFPIESYAPGEGITGKAVLPEAGMNYAIPHLSNEVHTDADVIQSHLALYNKKLKSGMVRHLIAVPLNKENGSFGVLRVVNKLTNTDQLTHDGFTQQDVNFMVTLASMVALAIENKHLLDRTKQGLDEISTLLEVNRSITQTLDLNEILKNIVFEAKRISGGDKILIQLIDEKTNTLVSRISDDPANSVDDKSPIHINEGVAGRAIRNRDVVYVPDTHVDPDFLPRGRKSLRALIVIPLFVAKRDLGLLNVNSSKVNPFTPEQIRQLKALAAPASIAIEKAQLYGKTRALHQVTTLVNARLDQSDMFSEVLPAFQQVVSFNSVSIQILVGDHLKIIHAWGFKNDRAVERISFPAHDAKFPNCQVIDRKRPVIIDDVQNRYSHFLDEGEVYYSENIRSWLGVPLIREDEVIGMIALDKQDPNYYTKADADLAFAFANHLAIALDNISLYKEKTQQTKMLAALVDASQGLITHSSLDELYRFCVTQGAKIFDVEDCSLSIIDEEGKVLRLVSSTCLPADISAASVTPLNSGGLRTYVVESGETLNFGGQDYKTHPAWSGKHTVHLQFLPSKRCHSLLMGPLVNGQGRITGVLRLENKLDHRAESSFSQVEEALLRTYSFQVGMAIERVKFFNRLDAEARLKARESLSHDLHDTASFVHGALVLRTAVAVKLLQANAIADLSGELMHLHKAARHTYNSIRLLHQDSREPILDYGLFYALKRYASMLSLARIETSGPDSRNLPPDIVYGLYKIGQEGLSNALHHAGPNVKVKVCLQIGDGYEMKIEDSGQGFDVAKAKAAEDSFGLQGMERWAESINGNLVVDSWLGRGTIITVSGQLVSGDEEE